VAGIYLVVAQRQAADLQHARDLARAGHYAQAARVAEGVSGASAAAASGVAAEALARGGGGAVADHAFARAVQADPTDWALWRDWAILLVADGQPTRARHQMEVAYWLNPRIALPPAFYFR
jgi:Flp pilus assembly protein TadD